MERDIIIYRGSRFIRYPNAKGRSERVYYSGWAVVDGLKKKIRYHVYKYLSEVGEIPKGFHVHHIDENTLNNEISNYECKPAAKHAYEHMNDERRSTSKITIEIARLSASEWHGSEAGRLWHKEHFNNSLLGEERDCICKFCNGEFKTKFKDENNSKYCSKKCLWKEMAKRHRASPQSKDERVCVICAKNFVCFKYNKTQTCSRKCSGKFRVANDTIKSNIQHRIPGIHQ